MRARRIATLLLSVLPFAASPALADRWFGSIAVHCDTFAYCLLSPEMPEPPGDPASLRLERSGKANAPVIVFMQVNKPVEGGTPIRLQFGDTIFELASNTDLRTERRIYDGKEYLAGYFLAEHRVAEVVAAMRKVDVANMKLDVAGKPQERTLLLDGMDAALRYLDQRQGRVGAQDALIEKGERAATDAPVPQVLPLREAWPKDIARIVKREKCAEVLFAPDELATGFVASPASGHDIWAIACQGGNYTVEFLLIGVRNGNMKTARVINLPIRARKLSLGSAINPAWREPQGAVGVSPRPLVRRLRHGRDLSLDACRLPAGERAAQGGLRRSVRRPVDQMARGEGRSGTQVAVPLVPAPDQVGAELAGTQIFGKDLDARFRRA